MATSNRISLDSIRQATNSLITWKSTKSQSEPQNLLADDEFFYLILSLKKIPTKSRLNPYKLPLPHPVHLASETELCLIIDDRSNSKLTEDDAVRKIDADGIEVSKVLEYSKLRTDYVAYEAKRKLCDSYDMFLVDKRIVMLLPKLIGKVFYKKKKMPVQIDLSHKNWKEQVERVIGSGLLYLRTGTCSVVKVARVGMDVEEIVENVMAAINAIVEIVPKKWDGVRSFHLKVSESISLPIYQALPDLKLKINGVERAEEEVVDEGDVVDERETKKKSSKKGKALKEVRLLDVEKSDLEDVEMGSEDDVADGAVEEAPIKKRKKVTDKPEKSKPKKKVSVEVADDGAVEEAPIKKRKKVTDKLEKSKPKKNVSVGVDDDARLKKVVKSASKDDAKDKVSAKKSVIKKPKTEGTNLKDKKRSRVAK